MLNEFKKFALRGNVLDLAIGIIIGAAFSSIVTSLVNDIIMPPIGQLLGGVNFSDLYINLSGESYSSLVEAQDAGAATINYGNFINAVINFLIVVFAIFLLVRAVNRVMGAFEEEKPAAAPTTKTCPYCQTDIPIKATRCPHCTSQLEEAPAA